jgi:enoyl-CoA hydratase/carnithine racemase
MWIDQPRQQVNRVTRGLWSELAIALENLAGAPPTILVIASRKPGTFLLNMEAHEVLECGPEQLDRDIETAQELLRKMRDLPILTVAAINGDCTGAGLELAMACKVRVVANDELIRLGLTQTRRGLVPVLGGIYNALRLVGLKTAISLAVCGDLVDPYRAARIHLVDCVVPLKSLAAKARSITESEPHRDDVCDSHRTLEWAERTVRYDFVGSAATAPLHALRILRNTVTYGESRSLNESRSAFLQLCTTQFAQQSLHQAEQAEAHERIAW